MLWRVYFNCNIHLQNHLALLFKAKLTRWMRSQGRPTLNIYSTSPRMMSLTHAFLCQPALLTNADYHHLAAYSWLAVAASIMVFIIVVCTSQTIAINGSIIFCLLSVIIMIIVVIWSLSLSPTCPVNWSLHRRQQYRSSSTLPLPSSPLRSLLVSPDVILCGWLGSKHHLTN